MNKSNAHIIAMTGSYFRGDSVPVLTPDEEALFTKVTYNYYEQLNDYEYLKPLGIGYHFYQGKYTEAIISSLLMEQFLAPNWKFKTKLSDDDKPKAGELKIRGLKEPSSQRVQDILDTDLNYLREDLDKINLLKEYDIYNILPLIESPIVKESLSDYKVTKDITSLEDVFADDDLHLLDDDSEGLFDFKHIPKIDERAQADFVARRKPCKDFDKYKPIFKKIQQDITDGKRKIVNFKIEHLHEGNFYIHNGLLFLLEKIKLTVKEHYREDGTRVRADGRTRCIFENGTESNMLKRSVEKLLYASGYSVSENIDELNEGFAEEFSSISSDDEEVGYIYVLKSKSCDPQIKNIQNLFKIGYSNVDVRQRIQNAEKEPTYLMAPVEIRAVWKCFNMNTQKLELCLHKFFSDSCLEIDVFDDQGKRYTPREWFIVPFEIIEQTIALILNGKVLNYKYDSQNEVIIKK